MTISEIEFWARDIVGRVRARQHIEDVRVELKAEWPLDHQKMARRIAGMCNAARGEPSLLIIGVDEEVGVVGVEPLNLADWRAQVARYFDNHMPRCLDVTVGFDDLSVVALQFETDSGPYVVTTGNGALPHEVPWRDATGVRSSRRADLLNILVPQRRLPVLEPIDAFVAVRCANNPPLPNSQWRVEMAMRVYVVPMTNDRVAMPFHLASLSCNFRHGGMATASHLSCRDGLLEGDNLNDQLFADRPVFAQFNGTSDEHPDFDLRQPVEVIFEAGVPGIPFKAIAKKTISLSQPNTGMNRDEIGAWGRRFYSQATIRPRTPTFPMSP